jgi:hypothetical protein
LSISAADSVADPQQGGELAFGQRRRPFQHRVNRLGIRAVGQLADAGDRVQCQALLGNGGRKAHASIP